MFYIMISCVSHICFGTHGFVHGNIFQRNGLMMSCFLKNASIETLGPRFKSNRSGEWVRDNGSEQCLKVLMLCS